MSTIHSIVSSSQPAAGERGLPRSESNDEGHHRFEEVMRSESGDDTKGLSDQKAEQTKENDENSTFEEQPVGEDQSAETDGNEDAANSEHIEEKVVHEELPAELSFQVTLTAPTPVIPEKTTAVQPDLESLPHGGILALQKEVKPSPKHQQAPLQGLDLQKSKVKAPAFASLTQDVQKAPDLSYRSFIDSSSMALEASEPTPKVVQPSQDQAIKSPKIAPSGALKSADASANQVRLESAISPKVVATTVVQDITLPVDPTQSVDRVRMVEAILKAGGGELRQMSNKVLQLKLNPPELGRVQIRVEQRGNELVMQFEVERVEALRAFQEMLPSLEFSLAQASGETVNIELRQTDDFSMMDESLSEDELASSEEEAPTAEDTEETEDEAPLEILRDGSTVQVTA